MRIVMIIGWMFLILSGTASGTTIAEKSPLASLTLEIRATPDASFYTELVIQSIRMYQEISKSKSLPAEYLPLQTDAYLTIEQNGTLEKYSLDKYGNPFQTERREILLLSPSIKKDIAAYIIQLRAIHYGEMLPWEEATKIIPRKSIFTVIDIETGWRFKVQRRAGSNHADVQPLTRADTKIMKEIYQGNWSWNRRAILVEADGQRIAASMHGMPHGQGALRNAFPGHFCIHFLDSRTHGSKNLDLSHQVMVHKAAGKLHDYMNRISPQDMVDIFLVAINQQDVHLLQMSLSLQKQENMEPLVQQMQNITLVSRISNFEQVDTTNLLALEIPMEVRIYRTEQGIERRRVTIGLKRNSFTDRWVIDQENLLQE